MTFHVWIFKFVWFFEYYRIFPNKIRIEQIQIIRIYSNIEQNIWYIFEFVRLFVLLFEFVWIFKQIRTFSNICLTFCLICVIFYSFCSNIYSNLFDFLFEQLFEYSNILYLFDRICSIVRTNGEYSNRFDSNLFEHRTSMLKQT